MRYLVSDFSPIGSLILKVLLATGLMNFSKVLRNIDAELEFLISGTSLLYYVSTKGENEF